MDTFSNSMRRTRTPPPCRATPTGCTHPWEITFSTPARCCTCWQKTPGGKKARTISGGVVRNSGLGRGVRVHAGALVEDCVIFDNCDIGRRAKVRRAILDKNVHVAADASIGYDPAADRAAGHHITESGLVVVVGA